MTTRRSDVMHLPTTNGAGDVIVRSSGTNTPPPASRTALPLHPAALLFQGSSQFDALPFFRLTMSWWQYSIDSMQRWILLLDTLRQRGNQFFEHEAADQPPVLVYDYEMLIDGRDLEHPVNYYLLHILPQPGQAIDSARRPFVIVDPRAGHGPGIGGSKEASQVGVALNAGHPVYFVGFRPRPEPGQTLEHVGRAEAIFFQEVARRHPDAALPCIIGNCQAGWAVAMLAAVGPHLTGPIVLNGAPLSYWAGVEGKNPMRYLGGLTGGAWVTSLLCDLGNGLFDGAYLVMNFENLNPANTLWTKLHNLYRKIDTEPPRYLNFEKWWNGFTLLTTDEMEFIVDNLFVGNRLESGQIELSSGRRVDLRNIEEPIVVFASGGDNITPPQQALNWLTDVYHSDEDILKSEQVIVYTLHEDIGHLGIFVSGRVAKREHTSIMGTMEFIAMLPPGLYELEIEQRGKDPADDPFGGEYELRFVERSLKDILAMDDTRADEEYFPSLAAVSEYNTTLYKTYLRPWVQLFSNEWTAQLLRQTLPIRLQHYVFSDRNPWMSLVSPLAEIVRANRQPVTADNPFVQYEQSVSATIINALDTYRDVRDGFYRVNFNAIYGPLGIGAFFPTRTTERQKQVDEAFEQRVQARFTELRGKIDQGGFAEGFSRILLLLSRADQDVEPGAFVLLREALQTNPRLSHLDPEQMGHINREQFLTLYIARDEAVTMLPKLLPSVEDRREALELAKHIVLFGNRPNQAEQQVLDQVAAVLELSMQPG